MAKTSKRIFGANMTVDVRNKLAARQAFQQSDDPLNSTVAGQIEDPNLVNIGLENSNMNGVNLLGSQVPFARMWTAIQILDLSSTPEEVEAPIEQSQLEADYKDYLYTWNNSSLTKINKQKIVRNDLMIYEIGNHTQNQMALDPSKPIADQILNTVNTNPSDGQNAEIRSAVAPYPGETNNNEYMRAPVGITKVSSTTEGSLGPVAGLRKTTVEFSVHNFHDYDKIYSKYFLRPGALVFVDYGWANQGTSLYNPADIVQDNDWQETLFGNDDGTEPGVLGNYKGDADVVCGVVTNFSSQVNKEDGSFQCSVDILSRNVMLQRANFEQDADLKNRLLYKLESRVLFDVLNTFAPEVASQMKEMINEDGSFAPGNLAEWEKVAALFASENITSSYYNIPNTENKEFGVYWQQKGKKGGGAGSLYVSMGYLENKILNHEFASAFSEGDLEDVNADTITFNTVGITNFDFNLYQRQRFKADASSLKYLYGSWKKDDTKPATGYYPISMLFVNLKFIARCIKGSYSISEFYAKLLTEINEDSGGVFDFFLGGADNEGGAQELSVLDRNFLPPPNMKLNGANLKRCSFKSKGDDYITDETTFGEEMFQDISDESQGTSYSTTETDFLSSLFTFSPLSPKSIVKDMTYNFDMGSDKLSSQIAIGSLGAAGRTIMPMTDVLDEAIATNYLEDTETITDVDTNETQTIWDRSVAYVPDRGSWQSMKKFLGKDTVVKTLQFLPETLILDNSNQTITTGTGKKSDDFDKALENAVDKKGKVGSGGGGTAKKVNTRKEVQNLEKNYNVKAAGSSSDYFLFQARKEYVMRSKPTILPIKMSLSIYGISTIQPGDSFTIDYLPSRYKGRVFFQTLTVSNEIDGVTWTTTLEAIMRWSPKSKEEAIDNSRLRTPNKIVCAKTCLSLDLPAKLTGFENILPYILYLEPITEFPSSCTMAYNITAAAALEEQPLLGLTGHTYDKEEDADGNSNFSGEKAVVDDCGGGKYEQVTEGDSEHWEFVVKPSFSDVGDNTKVLAVFGKGWVILPKEKFQDKTTVNELSYTFSGDSSTYITAS